MESRRALSSLVFQWARYTCPAPGRLYAVRQRRPQAGAYNRRPTGQGKRRASPTPPPRRAAWGGRGEGGTSGLRLPLLPTGTPPTPGRPPPTDRSAAIQPLALVLFLLPLAQFLVVKHRIERNRIPITHQLRQPLIVRQWQPLRLIGQHDRSHRAIRRSFPPEA